MPSVVGSRAIERAVKDLLREQLDADIGVESLGIRDFNDDEQLILKTPAVRTRYGGKKFRKMHDNTAQNYDVLPVVEVWCADEDLSSKEAQREISKGLSDQVESVLAGARVPLGEAGEMSEPIELLDLQPFPQDILGMVYILTVGVPGIAQYPGGNA
jgi:hypothetical protein